MSDNVTQKLQLTPPQRLWLEAACRKVSQGEQPDARSLMVELLDKIPSDFNPGDIDSRLLWGSARPTILALALITPNLPIVQKASQVWKSIHGLLRAKPTTKIISADEISQATGLSKMDVAEILENMSRIRLYGSGTVYGGNGRSGWGTINMTDNEKAFNSFVRFETLAHFLGSIVNVNLFDSRDVFMSGSSMASNLSEKQFRVALSFPGEKRPFVAQVADILQSRVGNVFYDYYFEADLARPNLDTLLQGIYHDHSDLIVVFLCKDYEQKEWCGLEWRAVRDLIKKRYDNIMLIRFDDAKIPGILSIDGYVDLRRRSPEQAADLIVKRYHTTSQTNLTRNATHSLPSEASQNASSTSSDLLEKLVAQAAFQEMLKTIGEVSSALLVYANTAESRIKEERIQEATRVFRNLAGDLLAKRRVILHYELFEKHNLLPSKESIGEASRKLVLLSNSVGSGRHDIFSDAMDRVKAVLWLD